MINNTATILNKTGEIIFYSLEDFIDKIVKGDDCFICGASRKTKTFNDEHILPSWLLRKYNLHNDSITLSNSFDYKYGSYTISCCEECNSDLGINIEEPISELLKLNYQELAENIKSNQRNLHLIFKWLLLIFFKAHLKDTELNYNQDRRKEQFKIAETYDWNDMHHLHCMVRKDYTRAKVNTNTIGSIFILPALEHKIFQQFDFADNKAGQVIMIRLNDICILCVLNDSGAINSILIDMFKKIKGPLSPLQIREIFVHMLYVNLNLKNRPKFYSKIEPNSEYSIYADIPDKLELISTEERIFTLGELLLHYTKVFYKSFFKDYELLEKEILEGKRTFLFDDNGNFLNHNKVINKSS